MRGLLALALLAATAVPPTSVVYSRYRSGRPRLVVKATHNPDELLLLRYADAPRARPRTVAREELDSWPGGVRLEKVIDPKDVVVTMAARHGESAIVDRVLNDRLVRMADSFGEAIDLDGDSVPEIVSGWYAGRNQCGVHLSTSIQQWNGKRFVDDDRRYVAALAPGAGAEDGEVRLSASKRYAVRIFGPGRVTLDDEEIEPDKAFETEEDCHTIALRGGSARTRAFLEELP